MNNKVKITFSGDILSYPRQNTRMKKKGMYNYMPYFNRVSSLLKESDYVCGSLETPVGDKGFSNTYYNFNTHHSFLRDLKKVGFDMLTTANNHCLDRGMEGLFKTLHYLDSYDIDTTGTFLTDDCRKYFIKDFSDLKVAFISYTYGTNSSDNGFILDDSQLGHVNLTRLQESYIKRPLFKNLIYNIFSKLPLTLREKIRPIRYGRVVDSVSESEINSMRNKQCIDKMLNNIREAKNNSDYVVFCLHSGGQFNDEVGPYTKWLISLIAEEGVDCIITNHAHVVLDTKFIGSTFVANALGNFSFTPHEGYYIENVLSDYSILINLIIDKGSHKLDSISFNVLKNITDKGFTEVVPVYDLYNECQSEELKLSLYNDMRRVVCKVLNHQEYDFSVCKEYIIYKN